MALLVFAEPVSVSASVEAAQSESQRGVDAHFRFPATGSEAPLVLPVTLDSGAMGTAFGGVSQKLAGRILAWCQRHPVVSATVSAPSTASESAVCALSQNQPDLAVLFLLTLRLAGVEYVSPNPAVAAVPLAAVTFNVVNLKGLRFDKLLLGRDFMVAHGLCLSSFVPRPGVCVLGGASRDGGPSRAVASVAPIGGAKGGSGRAVASVARGAGVPNVGSSRAVASVVPGGGAVASSMVVEVAPAMSAPVSVPASVLVSLSAPVGAGADVAPTAAARVPDLAEVRVALDGHHERISQLPEVVSGDDETHLEPIVVPAKQGTKPRRAAPRRQSPAQLRALTEFVCGLRDAGVIEPWPAATGTTTSAMFMSKGPGRRVSLGARLSTMCKSTRTRSGILTSRLESSLEVFVRNVCFRVAWSVGLPAGAGLR